MVLERTHRIVYQVRAESGVLLALKVADRKEVYARLDDLKGLLR